MNRKRYADAGFAAPSGLAVWLMPLVLSFHPDDACFVETKLKPILAKRTTGPPRRCKPQLAAFRLAILNNYPDLVSDDLKQLVKQYEHDTLLNKKEILLLQTSKLL